jgi:hypothetical protein
VGFTDIESAEAAIRAHPLCSVFASDAHRFIVYYPLQYKLPGGTLALRIGGDLAALNSIYAAMQAVQLA